MWIAQLHLTTEDLTPDVNRWVEKYTYRNNIEISTIKETGEKIVSFDTDHVEDLNKFYNHLPENLQVRLREAFNICDLYLSANFGNGNPNVSTELQSQREYCLPENWAPWYMKPFETPLQYHKRLTEIIPPQVVVQAVAKLANEYNAEWGENLQVIYKDINLNVFQYVEAMHIREGDKYRALIRRTTASYAKIRQLRQDVTLDIIKAGRKR